VIIHAYNDHVRLLSPEPLVVNNHSLLGSKEPTLLCNQVKSARSSMSGNATYQASEIPSVSTSAFVGTNPTGELITSGLPARNPKPAGLGREPYRCLREGRIIKARDSAMLET
jgi:hypothetical protein